MKTTISRSMVRTDSCLRVLFATEAFGMGADAPDIREVTHLSPPTTLESELRLFI